MNWLLASQAIIVHFAVGFWAYQRREQIAAWFKEMADDEAIQVQASIMVLLRSSDIIEVDEKKKIWQAVQANKFDAEKLKAIHQALVEKIQKGNVS